MALAGADASVLSPTAVCQPARSHRGCFSVNETETTFIETQAELNFDAKFNFRNFFEKSAVDVAPKTPDLLTYLI